MDQTYGSAENNTRCLIRVVSFSYVPIMPDPHGL